MSLSGGGKRGVGEDEVRALVVAFQGRLSVKLDFEGLTVKRVVEIGVARVSVWVEHADEDGESICSGRSSTVGILRSMHIDAGRTVGILGLVKR